MWKIAYVVAPTIRMLCYGDKKIDNKEKFDKRTALNKLIPAIIDIAFVHFLAFPSR